MQSVWHFSINFLEHIKDVNIVEGHSVAITPKYNHELFIHKHAGMAISWCRPSVLYRPLVLNSLTIKFVVKRFFCDVSFRGQISCSLSFKWASNELWKRIWFYNERVQHSDRGWTCKRDFYLGKLVHWTWKWFVSFLTVFWNAFPRLWSLGFGDILIGIFYNLLAWSYILFRQIYWIISLPAWLANLSGKSLNIDFFSLRLHVRTFFRFLWNIYLRTAFLKLRIYVYVLGLITH